MYNYNQNWSAGQTEDDKSRNFRLVGMILAIVILVILVLVIFIYLIAKPASLEELGLRLASDDPATRNMAAFAVAWKGKSAAHDIRLWLTSENDNLVVGACLALTKMDDDVCESVMQELKEVLCGPYSEKTDAAVAVLYHMGYTTCPVTSNSAMKLNFLLYQFSHEKDDRLRRPAFKQLLKLADPCLVQPLLVILHTNPHDFTRLEAVIILREIDDARAVGPLITALENDSAVRIHAADALGELGDARAILPIIEAMNRGHLRHGDAKYNLKTLTGIDGEKWNYAKWKKWYSENKSRIVLDEKKQKYYLKPASSPD